MYKKIAFLLIVCLMATTLVLVSCGGTSLQEFSQKYVSATDKAWYEGDTSALSKLEDPNIVYHMQNLGMDLNGWPAHEKMILDTRSMITNMQEDMKYQTGEGNHFAMSYKSHSVMPGETPDKSMDVTVSSLFLFRLDKGKVVEVWVDGSTTMTPVSQGQ
jgi:hypothetical protein